MIKKILIILILIGIFISGCDISEIDQEVKVEEDVRDIKISCQFNNECDWVITNCCSENAGAIWKCANKIESKIVCPEGKYDCAASESPKPIEPCNCVDNLCQEKEVGEIPKEKYCEQDSDCVWAFNPKQCCNCPRIHNIDIVKENDELVIYEKGKDYSSFITGDCSGIQCSPCGPITELECVNNQCQKCMGGDKSIWSSSERLGPRCCEGLTQIAYIVKKHEEWSTNTDLAFCTNCGDGLCKEPENIKNCPEDCETHFK